MEIKITATLKKNQYGEWVARFRENGILKPEWTYYTNDKEDAKDTIAAVIKGERK